MGVQGFHKKNKGTASVFKDVYLIDGKRTPFGKMKGSLATVSPTDLAIHTSRSTLESCKIDPSEIDQTIATNIGMASADAFFLPRHIALYSGAPLASPAVLVQRLCGSGMEVLGTAAEQIGMNKSQLILTSGVEVMSRIPVASFSARMGFDLGRPEFIDFLWDGLNDSAATPMGCTADLLAKEYKIGREETDQYAQESQNRYSKAHAAGFF